MRKVIYIICFFGILIGCVNSNKKESIQKENRELMVFDLYKLVRDDQCEMTRIENDSVVLFKYKNLIDSAKNLEFEYWKKESKIHFGPEQFVIAERSVLIGEDIFDRYEVIEPIPDGMGPVIFNSEYGVLAFDNGWGMEFHLLSDKNKEEFELPLISSLYNN